MSSPLESGAYRKLRSRSPGRQVRMVAASDFSGLTSSTWALAKAEASAATVSLDRGMGCLRLQHIKTHRARFRSLRSHPVPDCLLGVLGNEVLEFVLCSLVVEEGSARIAKQRRELRPGVR